MVSCDPTFIFFKLSIYRISVKGTSPNWMTDYEWDVLAIVKSAGISIACCNKELAAFHRIEHGLEG